MGYTHYWHRPAAFDLDTFIRFRKDVDAILTACEQQRSEHPLICGPGGEGPPILTNYLVSFNGCNTTGGCHETFYVPQEQAPRAWNPKNDDGLCFHFCKTEQKPYDRVVTASLIALQHHFPEVVVSSDGGPVEWEAGVKLCQDILGYGEVPKGVEC